MELDGADVKPSVINFLIVVTMAVVGIYLGKTLTARYHVPGLTQLFANI